MVKYHYGKKEVQNIQKREVRNMEKKIPVKTWNLTEQIFLIKKYEVSADKMFIAWKRDLKSIAKSIKK